MLGGIFGALMLAAAGGFAFRKIDRSGRPEAHVPGRLALSTVVGCVVIGAFVWVPVSNGIAASALRSDLGARCLEAKEEVFRTVDDVRGIYIQPPTDGDPSDVHNKDRDAGTFVRGPERPYEFVEIALQRGGGQVRRSTFSSWAGSGEVQPAATARYGFTWIALHDYSEGNLGLYGFESVIFDRETGEILARRTAYHLRGRRGGTAVPSLDCAPEARSDGTRVQPGRNKGSYDFVARVLRPAEIQPPAPVAIAEPETPEPPPAEQQPALPAQPEPASVEERILSKPVLPDLPPKRESRERPWKPPGAERKKIYEWTDAAGNKQYTDYRSTPPEYRDE